MVFNSFLTGLKVGNMLILSLSICKQTHTKVSQKNFLKSEIIKCGEKKDSVIDHTGTTHCTYGKEQTCPHFTLHIEINCNNIRKSNCKMKNLAF